MLFQGEPYRYEFAKGPTLEASPCPGYYCGRIQYSNGSFSSCGACPTGFRRMLTGYECLPCDKDLLFYDWLYLGFMGMLPILFHMCSTNRKNLTTRDTLCSVVLSVLEIIISATITLLAWEPRWTFRIKSCGVTNLSDWYPIFYNPSPNYEETLHCSSEQVYPLYTIILVFYAVADAVMLILRFTIHFFGFKVLSSVYAALYFYPILALSHLILGGFIYSIFPYCTILGSIVSCAYHFAKRENQGFQNLVADSLKDWRNGGIILCHWFLHAYGIISVTQLSDLTLDLSLLTLVPAPTLLYIATVSFTDPTKLHAD